MKNRGLMIAGALILAAIYILGEEEAPFTQTFTPETFPKILKDKIELLYDGILITVSNISKNSDMIQNTLDDKQFGAIMLNKMRDEFGLREKFGGDGDE